MSREIGIHQSSMFHIIHDDLGLKCLKKCRTQKVIEANRVVRMQLAKKPLEMYPKHKVDFILFTSEKVIHSDLHCKQQSRSKVGTVAVRRCATYLPKNTRFVRVPSKML